MKPVCPLCAGAGKTIYIVKHSVTGKPKTAIRWCLCSKSKFVSESPDHKILTGLGESYIPLQDVDPQLTFIPDDLGKCPNYLIEYGTDADSFRYHVKGVIMKFGFGDPPPLFLCCDSIEILKRFYVAQDDGSSPSLTDINKYDLVVIGLGVSEKNDQLKTCISQVVYNRLSIKKPTWIFLKTPYERCIQEKSDDLEAYLKKFTNITLSDTHTGAPVKPNSKSKDIAEGFKPR
jgi:hypothetical protein